MVTLTHQTEVHLGNVGSIMTIDAFQEPIRASKRIILWLGSVYEKGFLLEGFLAALIFLRKEYARVTSGDPIDKEYLKQIQERFWQLVDKLLGG